MGAALEVPDERGQFGGGHSGRSFGEPDEVDETDREPVPQTVVVDRRPTAAFDRLEHVTAQDRVESGGESVEQTDRFVDLRRQLELARPGGDMG